MLGSFNVEGNEVGNILPDLSLKRLIDQNLLAFRSPEKSSLWKPFHDGREEVSVPHPEVQNVVQAFPAHLVEQGVREKLLSVPGKEVVVVFWLLIIWPTPHKSRIPPAVFGVKIFAGFDFEEMEVRYSTQDRIE